MSDLEKFVKDAINSHKIVIFSKSYCPFCEMAKEVFKKLNEDYNAIELDKRPDGDGIQAILLTITGIRTVPQVFVHGNFIGGGTDVKALYENGELSKIISK